MSRPPLPPFTRETAAQKARMAEDAWNSRDPERVALAYTEDSRWRNRAEFFAGRAAIVAFLTPQMGEGTRIPPDQGSLGVRSRTASRCASSTNGTTLPGSGTAPTATSNGSSTSAGLMRRREASINDQPIAEQDRRFRWAAPGPRPADVAGLSESPF